MGQTNPAPQQRLIEYAVDRVLDETNTEVGVAWRFTGCRPVALHYSPLDALEAAVVTETIVLAFDDVEMS